MMTIDDMLSQVAKITGKALSEKPVTNTVKAQSKETVKSDLTVKPVFNGIADKKTVTLSLAKEISYCIEQGAKMLGVNVVIAVTNSDGRLLLLHAMDNSFIASLQAAQDKAYTAAAL